MASSPEPAEGYCAYCGAPDDGRATVHCPKNPSGKYGAPHFWTDRVESPAPEPTEAMVEAENGLREANPALYWCPRCKRPSERLWHFCEKGPPLIPQLDVETCCVEVPLSALAVSPGCRGAELVPASVLEERDRELEVERRRSNGVAGHAGHWAKCARESALEAEQLRSHLTEARARFAELDSDETHPDNLDYVATNVLVMLDVLLDVAPGLNSGDWFHQLRNWAVRNRSGLMEPNYLAEHLRTYLHGLGLVPAPEDREPA